MPLLFEKAFMVNFNPDGKQQEKTNVATKEALPDNTGNKTLVIVGMHRSGTSLITQWLHHCGLSIGESLLGAGLGNQDGHWEDNDFYDLHLAILRDNQVDDSGLIDHSVKNIGPKYLKKLKDIIFAKNKLFRQWGWKDPRTCLFLDVYRELLPDANYFIAIRDYPLVVLSLLKRTFAQFDHVYDPEKGYFSKLIWYKFRRPSSFKKYCYRHTTHFLKVWIFYNEEILKFIRLLPQEKYILTNYTFLKDKDETVYRQLTQKWHYSLHYVKFSVVFKQELISTQTNVDLFISDQQLIKKAKKLTQELNIYFIR